MYYSYLTSRPGQTGWSTPRKIDGTALGNDSPNLVVTGDGAIHVTFSGYYTTASAPDAIFTEPVRLADSPELSMTKDESDNLYIAYADGQDCYLRKKSASSSTWSDPILAYTSVTQGLSRDIHLAVADANSYYISSVEYAGEDGNYQYDNVFMLVSTDGGSTWTKKALINGMPRDNEIVGSNERMPVVAVSSAHVITFMSDVYDPVSDKTNIKVWRSNDGGTTWSAPVTIPGQANPSVVLDNAGKAHIMVLNELNSDTNNANLLYVRER